jgi:hypothetical protein
MSDDSGTPLPPPSADEPADGAVESEVFAQEAALDAAEDVAETRRRVWFMRMIRRERRREKIAKDRTTMINSLVTVFSTAIVAGTATYATLKSTKDSLGEERRGSRVDAIVEHWSATIAEASTAVELLGQRSNDLWAYGTAIAEQGVLLDEALKNEQSKEQDYLSVRKNLASSTARAGLVSSPNTTDCLDKFIGLIDTWQNALNWTRSTLQVEDGREAGITAVNMQLEHRDSLNDAITILRKLSRDEFANAGEATTKCNIPNVDDIWAQLVPSDDSAATEDTTPEEETVPTEDTAPAEG